MPALLAAGAALQRTARARRRAGARAPAGRRPDRVPRHRRRRSAWSTRSARTAARRCSSAATKSAGCAASTTAGSSTATAPASTCRPSRRTRCSRPRCTIKAYPTWEGGDIVWTYMGPPELQPPLAELRMGARARRRTACVSKTFEHANYLQALEGGLDTAHSSFAHNEKLGDPNWIRNRDGAPRLDVERTDYGYTLRLDAQPRRRRQLRARLSLRDAGAGRCAAASRRGPASAKPTCRGSTATSGSRSTTSTRWVYNMICGATTRTSRSPTSGSQGRETRFGRGKDDLIPGTFKLKTQPRQRLPDRPADAEDEDLHRDRGHQHPRLRAARGDGPDRRPLARASRHVATRRSSRRVSCCSKRSTAVERGQPPRGVDPATYENVRPYDAVVPPGKNWEERIRARARREVLNVAASWPPYAAREAVLADLEQRDLRAP